MKQVIGGEADLEETPRGGKGGPSIKDIAGPLAMPGPRCTI